MNNNNYDYVDLGLPSGTLWATCNVGANKPYEYGKYFAWGETDGYYGDEDHDFSCGTYKYINEYDVMTKYNRQDWLTELELSDDAAHVNMGGDWKMPTSAQMGELFNETNHVWVSDYQGAGITGRVFTSNTNGNTIFIPASGERYSTYIDCHGYDARLWSSTRDSNNPNGCLSVYFNSVNFYVNYGNRYDGYCVRGVLNNKKQ